MFERFTERARQVVVLAQDEAKANRNVEIAPAHLLVGLIREEEGLGFRALANLGVGLSDARAKLPASLTQDEWVDWLDHRDSRSVQIPFTPASKKVLELGLREALSLGHNYIGTEHLLLAFARTELEVLGIPEQEIRDELMRMLMAGPRREPLSEDAQRARAEREERRVSGEAGIRVEHPTAKDMLEEDRRELAGKLMRMNALQMELATRGFYASVTTFHQANRARSVAPEGARSLHTLAGWNCRCNVVYDVFDRPAMDVLSGLAADHGCYLQWSQKHGATFYPADDHQSIAVVVR